MKLKTSFKIVIALSIVFGIASIAAVARIAYLNGEIRQLQKTIEEIELTPEPVPVEDVDCTEQTVIYDIESLERHLDLAAEEVINGN